MNELVERVARAIDPEAWGLPSNLEAETISDRDEARDHARAAIEVVIEALREPTEALLAALDRGGEKKDWPSGNMWKHVWQTLCDEALK
jgi:hypothetical protein